MNTVTTPSPRNLVLVHNVTGKAYAKRRGFVVHPQDGRAQLFTQAEVDALASEHGANAHTIALDLTVHDE